MGGSGHRKCTGALAGAWVFRTLVSICVLTVEKEEDNGVMHTLTMQGKLECASGLPSLTLRGLTQGVFGRGSTAIPCMRHAMLRSRASRSGSLPNHRQYKKMQQAMVNLHCRCCLSCAQGC